MISITVLAAAVEPLPNCTNCIIVSWRRGNDSSCLVQNTSSISPCKTIRHIFQQRNDSLNNKEVVLLGDHWITQTLTVSQVNGLTIRGNGSTIYCREPASHKDMGSGLVFQSVTNLKVMNVNYIGCGTLQYGTVMKINAHLKFRSAIYIINSTNIYFTGSSFYKSLGRGLSMYDVDGQIVIEKTDFFENMDTIKEKRELTGGGGVHIEFTECSPGFGLHIINSRYLMTECKLKSNEGFTSNDMDSHVIKNELVAGRYENVGYYGAGIGIVLRGFSFNNYIKITNCIFFNNTALDGGSISAIFSNKAQNNTVSITNSVTMPLKEVVHCF